jgi:formylglycine-generating enzyme required for sulfatase activity
MPQKPARFLCPSSGSSGPTAGSYRVYRDGGWHDVAWGCRPAFRLSGEPGYWDYALGLRVARVPADK